MRTNRGTITALALCVATMLLSSHLAEAGHRRPCRAASAASLAAANRRRHEDLAVHRRNSVQDEEDDQDEEDFEVGGEEYAGEGDFEDHHHEDDQEEYHREEEDYRTEDHDQYGRPILAIPDDKIKRGANNKFPAKSYEKNFVRPPYPAAVAEAVMGRGLRVDTSLLRGETVELPTYVNVPVTLRCKFVPVDGTDNKFETVVEAMRPGHTVTSSPPSADPRVSQVIEQLVGSVDGWRDVVKSARPVRRAIAERIGKRAEHLQHHHHGYEDRLRRSDDEYSASSQRSEDDYSEPPSQQQQQHEVRQYGTLDVSGLRIKAQQRAAERLQRYRDARQDARRGLVKDRRAKTETVDDRPAEWQQSQRELEINQLIDDRRQSDVDDADVSTDGRQAKAEVQDDGHGQGYDQQVVGRPIYDSQKGHDGQAVKGWQVGGPKNDGRQVKGWLVSGRQDEDRQVDDRQVDESQESYGQQDPDGQDVKGLHAGGHQDYEQKVVGRPVEDSLQGHGQPDDGQEVKGWKVGGEQGYSQQAVDPQVEDSLSQQGDGQQDDGHEPVGGQQVGYGQRGDERPIVGQQVKGWQVGGPKNDGRKVKGWQVGGEQGYGQQAVGQQVEDSHIQEGDGGQQDDGQEVKGQQIDDGQQVVGRQVKGWQVGGPKNDGRKVKGWQVGGEQGYSPIVDPSAVGREEPVETVERASDDVDGRLERGVASMEGLHELMTVAAEPDLALSEALAIPLDST